MDEKSGAEIFASFRELVHSVVVHDRQHGDVEVVGHLAALLGSRAEMLGGLW